MYLIYNRGWISHCHHYHHYPGIYIRNLKTVFNASAFLILHTIATSKSCWLYLQYIFLIHLICFHCYNLSSAPHPFLILQQPPKCRLPSNATKAIFVKSMPNKITSLLTISFCRASHLQLRIKFFKKFSVSPHSGPVLNFQFNLFLSLPFP